MGCTCLCAHVDVYMWMSTCECVVEIMVLNVRYRVPYSHPSFRIQGAMYVDLMSNDPVNEEVRESVIVGMQPVLKTPIRPQLCRNDHYHAMQR